jgi:acyl phosphate:glycerol-3-phosphate acyltransferase
MGMSDILIFIVVCIAAYLLGSIPFGFIFARARGVDIRQVGSGNTGATNIARSLGRKTGAIVAVLDFSKGFLPVLLAQYLFIQDWQVILVSVLPIIGHIFPIWLRFKGGKGVATTFGLLAGYFGPIYFLIFLLIWYLAVRVIKLMSLVNLVVGLSLPLAFWLNFREFDFTILGAGLGLILWWTHRENISRLLAGKENKI